MLGCPATATWDGIRVAVFDTRGARRAVVDRLGRVRLARLVRRHGAWLVVPPASFIVQGREGPLERGEVEHAHAWTAELLQAHGHPPGANAPACTPSAAPRTRPTARPGVDERVRDCVGEAVTAA